MSEDMFLLGLVLIVVSVIFSFLYTFYKINARSIGVVERELENERLELEIQKLELQKELQETESGKTEG